MIPTLATVDLAALAGFEDIVDVRSPAEFALDHIPGAINLPVLSDEERAVVGTIYVQDSRFRARRIGAALVARNIAAHLEGAMSEKPGSWAPLVYCWRGGQRSGAMATILAQVGWRPTLLEGGYRTWRRYVSDQLYTQPCNLGLVLLGGYTGLAKTEILLRVRNLGVQVLDLEGLAAHRGSLFGALPDVPQPDQKLFETHLLQAMAVLDPARPVLVEAESSKIGQRMIPPAFWRAMLCAPRIDLEAPVSARAAYLVTAYHDIIADAARLRGVLATLPGRHGHKNLAQWLELVDGAEYQALAEALMLAHYDPAYAQGRAPRPLLAQIELEDLGPNSQDSAAVRIADLMHSYGARPCA